MDSYLVDLFNAADTTPCTHPLSYLKDFGHLFQDARLLAVPSNLVIFLQDGNLHLPPLSTRGKDEDDDAISWGSSPPSTPPAMTGLRIDNNGDEDSSSSDDGSDSNHATRRQGPIIPPNLWKDVEIFRDRVNHLIEILDGFVIPKLDEKMPKDARWIALNKSLRCQNADDVFLLLKHSSIVDKILEKQNIICVHQQEPILSLFKWNDYFSPEYEFRCFVVKKRLLLISQRDTNQAYTSMVQDRDGIIFDIHAFFRNHLYEKFPLENYVFDVMRNLNSITLVDFNTFGPETDTGLSSFDELVHLSGEMEENLAHGGIGRGLVEPMKYGEPYFRYATEGVVASANPDLQCPLPLEMITHVLKTPQENDNI